MTNRLATSLIALSTAMAAAPALADVTAADVWSNQQAFYGAMGVSLGGDLSGDQLSNPEINVILPQGIATFQIKTDAVTMADNGDGTVTISYPSPMTISIAGGVEGEASFTANAVMTHDGYNIIASGDPGDITYASDGQNLRFELGEITIDEPGAEEVTMEGFVTLTNWTGTSRVTEGNLITYTTESEVGTSNADFTFTIDNVTSRSVQSTLPVSGTVTASLPVGGSDVMNLSEAMRNGLSVALTSTGEGSNSEAETTVAGEMFNRQVTSTGPQVFDLSLDESGLKIDAEAADFDMTMNDSMLFPGDIELGIGGLSLNYDIPLNASEQMQDFRLAFGMADVTLGDAIWDMFDPAAQLPRDPAEISFDVTGFGTNGTDLLDFAAMAQMFGPPPIQIDEVTIENLRIAAVGAEATATGEMTFDWTDFQTIPGIARPEGQVTVNLNGVNQLMDTLAAMGLIPEEELMMPRMMMGMFSTPVGDDMLETVLEVNSEGHVLANGQRIQ